MVGPDHIRQAGYRLEVTVLLDNSRRLLGYLPRRIAAVSRLMARPPASGRAGDGDAKFASSADRVSNNGSKLGHGSLRLDFLV